MPKGVETYVDGKGFATVDFVDPSLRGPALAKLIELGGAESVETITRDGPRRKYRVPEGNASEVGLIDTPLDAPVRGDAGWADALARQSSAVPGNPGLAATSVGANDAGPVDQTDVLSNQSILSTESTAAPQVPGATPLHSDVISTVAKAANAARKATRKRAGELADQRPPQTSAANVNAALASQSGALATDPQSRGGEGIQPISDVAPAQKPADGPAEEPSLDWPRTRIDEHAAEVHGIDTTTAPNKQAALDQIEETKS